MRLSPVQHNKFQRMETAVRKTEQAFMRQRAANKGPVVTFPTSAPYNGVYAPTPTETFMLHVERQPELKADLALADLGSGLGELCFTASFPFKKVVGYEMDPELIRAADNIREQLGFQNVDFRQENFLAADLSEFDVLMVYLPFMDNFVPLMTERLLDTRPGTFVISNNTYGTPLRIFDRNGQFQRLAAEGEPPETSWSYPLETYQRL